MVPCKCFMKCQPNDFQMWCYPWFTRLHAGERDLPACWLCAVRRRSSVWLTPRVFTDVNRNGLNYYTLPHSWVEAQYDQTVLYSIVEPCPYSSRFFTCVATVWNHRRNKIEPLAFIWKQDAPESLSWMDCNHTQPIFFGVSGLDGTVYPAKGWTPGPPGDQQSNKVVTPWPGDLYMRQASKDR